MSSWIRNRERRRLKALGVYPDRPSPTRIDDTGYWALHPTRGWKRTSYRRIAAQDRMLELLEGGR